MKFPSNLSVGYLLDIVVKIILDEPILKKTVKITKGAISFLPSMSFEWVGSFSRE